MPPSGRRPPALLPAAAARLAGFAALALLGAVQWQRLVDSLTWGDALLWVLVAVLAAVGILWADALSRFRGTARSSSRSPRSSPPTRRPGSSWRCSSRGGSTSSAPACRTAPRRSPTCRCPTRAPTRGRRSRCSCSARSCACSPGCWRSGRGSAAAATSSSRSPCCSCSSPRRSSRWAARSRSLLGVGLTALTVCFLWLERLPLRPGLGIAAMLGARPRRRAPARLGRRQGGAVVRLQGVRRGARARRAAAVRLGPQLRADDLAARRRGGAAGRHAAGRPTGRSPTSTTSTARPGSTASTTAPGIAERRGRPRGRLGGRARRGETSLRVTLRRIETLRRRRHRHDARRAERERLRRAVGRAGPVALGQRCCKGGDSYTVDGYAPRPNGQQLSESWSGADGRQTDDLDLSIPIERGAPPALDPDDEIGRLRRRAAIRFAPFAPSGSAPAPLRVVPDADAVQRRRPRAAALALRADLGARAAADAGVRDAVRVRRGGQPLPPGRASATTRRPDPVEPGRRDARRLPVRHQERLLPALLGRDGDPAADGRDPGARGDRLLARRLLQAQAGVDRARHRRALVGRGVVRRLRLGDVRPDAGRHAGAVADRGARAAARGELGPRRRRGRARAARRRAPAACAPTCSARSPARAAPAAAGADDGGPAWWWFARAGAAAARGARRLGGAAHAPAQPGSGRGARPRGGRARGGAAADRPPGDAPARRSRQIEQRLRPDARGRRRTCRRCAPAATRRRRRRRRRCGRRALRRELAAARGAARRGPARALGAARPGAPERSPRQPASAARRDCWRISERMRSRRGSTESSTCVIAAATAGWRSAISACIWWATAR